MQYKVESKVLTNPPIIQGGSIPIWSNSGQLLSTSVIMDSKGNIRTPGLINGDVTNSKEFWISTNQATLNLGTISQPFDGSTQSKFDTIMNSLPANSTLHLMAGTYQTKGNLAFTLKTGQKIKGAGIDVSILQIISSTTIPDIWAIQGPSGGWGEYIEITDLTIDGNYVGGIVNRHGIGINGSNTTIKNVKIINLGYGNNDINSEAWGISLSNFPVIPNHSSSVGNLIEGCEISNWKGGTRGLTAIGVAGYYFNYITAIIRNNRILITGLNRQCAAINFGWATDVLVEGNYIEGASVAFYGDTGDSKNITYINNTVKNVFYGFLTAGNLSRQNIKILNNNIELANPNDNSSVEFFHFNDLILNPSGIMGNYNNINISSNVLSVVTGSPMGNCLLGYFNSICGLVFENNIISTGIKNLYSNTLVITGCKNICFNRNIDFDGNSVYLSAISQ